MKLRALKKYLSLKLRTSRNLMSAAVHVLVLISVLFFLIFSVILLNISNELKSESTCYFDNIWMDGKTLKEISDNLLLRNSSQQSSYNVFFHETSCIRDGILRLNARQACAIESTGQFLKIKLYKKISNYKYLIYSTNESKS